MTSPDSRPPQELALDTGGPAPSQMRPPVSLNTAEMDRLNGYQPTTFAGVMGI